MDNNKPHWSRRAFIGGMGLGALGLNALPGATLNAAAASGSSNEDFAIVHGPVLQAPGTGEATVTWHTSQPAVSRVLYGEGDVLDRIAVVSRDGLLPNDSTCHAIRLTGLTPGKPFRYQLVSRAFRGYATPYMPRFGAEIQSEIFTATPTDPAERAFSFLMWNDIHDDSKRLQAMFDDVSWEGVAFVVLNGDIINDFVREQQFFRAFYDACAQRFGSAIPLVFVRGNHETRGGMARRFAEYVPGPAGRPYYAFTHGGVHFLALDSGEDKPDDNQEYFGLVEFASFREQQTAWLRSVLASEEARTAHRRIVLSHQPMAPVGTDGFGAREVRRLWRPLINEANACLWLSGHTHALAWVKPGEDGDNVFHAMTNPQDATTRVDVAPEAIRVSVIQKGGALLHEETLV